MEKVEITAADFGLPENEPHYKPQIDGLIDWSTYYATTSTIYITSTSSTTSGSTFFYTPIYYNTY